MPAAVVTFTLRLFNQSRFTLKSAAGRGDSNTTDLLSLAADSLCSVKEKQIRVVLGFTATTETCIGWSTQQRKMNQNGFYRLEAPPSFSPSELHPLASHSTLPAGGHSLVLNTLSSLQLPGLCTLCSLCQNSVPPDSHVAAPSCHPHPCHLLREIPAAHSCLSGAAATPTTLYHTILFCFYV